jgi:hypothetical protein
VKFDIDDGVRENQSFGAHVEERKLFENATWNEGLINLFPPFRRRGFAELPGEWTSMRRERARL